MTKQITQSELYKLSWQVFKPKKFDPEKFEPEKFEPEKFEPEKFDPEKFEPVPNTRADKSKGMFNSAFSAIKRNPKRTAGIAAGIAAAAYGGYKYLDRNKKMESIKDKEMRKSAFLIDEDLCKVAWTARDVNQTAWRKAGGFLRESIPWKKGFTSGMSQKLEKGVVDGFIAKKDIAGLTKYRDQLLSRSSKTYAGKNISRGAGQSVYEGLGRAKKEVNADRALRGINRDTFGRHFQTIVDANAKKNMPKPNLSQVEDELAVKTKVTQTGKWHTDGSPEMYTQSIETPVVHAYDTPSEKYSKGITGAHEMSEGSNDVRIVKGPKTYGFSPRKMEYSGVGSHLSQRVLSKEQVNLRDAPDDVYNKFMDLRNGTRGPGSTLSTKYLADKIKLDHLKKEYGAKVTPYGTDLRYRRGEVKSVDAASDKQLEEYMYAGDKGWTVKDKNGRVLTPEDIGRPNG